MFEIALIVCAFIIKSANHCFGLDFVYYSSLLLKWFFGARSLGMSNHHGLFGFLRVNIGAPEELFLASESIAAINRWIHYWTFLFFLSRGGYGGWIRNRMNKCTPLVYFSALLTELAQNLGLMSMKSLSLWDHHRLRLLVLRIDHHIRGCDNRRLKTMGI